MQSSSAATALPKFDQEDYQGNAHQAFQEYVDSFAYEYDAIAKEPPKELDAAGKAAWVEQNKRKLFLGRFASRNLQRAFEAVTTTDERSTLTFKDLVSKLNEHFKTGSNTTLANFEFFKLRQKGDESFDAFAIRVKHDARKCDFSCASDQCSVPDTLSRDQIITGVLSDEIRKHALKNQWSLEDLIKNGRQVEAASQGVVQMKNSTAASQDNLNFVKRIRKPGKYSNKARKQNNNSEKNQPQNSCTTCSSRACHGGRKCPGTKIECFECGKKGHFKGAQICQKRQKKPVKPNRRVETESEDSPSDSDSSGKDSPETSSDEETKKTFRVMRNVTKIRRMRLKRSIRHTGKTKRYEVDIVMKETLVKAFADTGADICIMSKRQAKALGLKLMKTKMSIRPYGSRKMKCCGYCIVTVMYGKCVANVGIYIINKDVETLLSGPVAEELGIITFNGDGCVDLSDGDDTCDVKQVEDMDPLKEHIKRNYPNLSSGRVGKLHNYQVKYHIDESVPAAIDSKRPIPYHLQERFEREITSMTEDGICSEHHGPAPWISNPVLCPKPDGGMRVTVDMANPNRAIKQTNIPIPRVEDIKSRMAGNNVFSKLDFKSAFFQLELDEGSKMLTVFYAGNRLMRLNRVVQGCCPSSGELSKALAPLFHTLPQVHLIHDDLIVATKTQREHRKVLEKVLQIIEDSGMTLNLGKCLFEKDEIPFWGLIISKDGLKPDPSKVDSLKEASAPTNKAELSSFLCMIQSNRDFIPNLASKTQHMRKRLKKDIHFTWDHHCQREFEDLKSSFTKSCLLHHFDPCAHTYICVDAHSTGLSAILMQGDSIEEAKPIAFASRTTTDAEARYPQLDLEALSVDFGLRRFRYYLVGGPTVEVITDHKPLVSIFANKRKGSIRTSRIKLRHQDIKYQVIWRKGSDNPSDFLSRHATPLNNLPTYVQEESNELEKTIWYLHFGPYIESISIKNIIKETCEDSTLKQLKRYIKKGYIPATVSALAPFRKIFDHLIISDEGLVMKDEKIVLPETLHDIAVKKAHQGAHPGMSGMKRRLRTHFWFPKMNTVIENFVSKCEECQMFTNKRSKHTITPLSNSNKAWDNVSIDLFGPMPDRKHVIVVLDNASRFPAAKIVPSTAAKPVLKAINEIYTDFGQPSTHRTDNGPPFNSAEFSQFSPAKGIEHIKTYPYHPQANPAETFMKPLGKAMKSVFHNNENRDSALNHLLTSYRSTPHPATGQPPGAMMLRSGYKTEFPPTPLSDESCKAAFRHDQHQKVERGHNINIGKHRVSSELKVGDQVYIRNQRTSKFQPNFGPATFTIVDIANGGAIVRSDHDHTTYTRHVDDLKLAPIVEQNSEITWFAPDTVTNPPLQEQLFNQDEIQAEAAGPQGRPVRVRRPPARYQDYVLTQP